MEFVFHPNRIHDCNCSFERNFFHEVTSRRGLNWKLAIRCTQLPDISDSGAFDSDSDAFDSDSDAFDSD